MGMFDTVVVEEGVELPSFPDDLDAHAINWQTKDISSMPSMERYKLTADGRLLRREVERREKTPEEKQQEAEEHGFDSWEEFMTTLRDSSLEERVANDCPSVMHETVVNDEWWADHNYHGSFEFHATSPDDSPYDVFWSYEARFTRGELDEIVLLGERGSDAGPDEVRARIRGAE